MGKNKKTEFKWEKLTDTTYKAKVEGGYLYLAATKKGEHLAMTFVPDVIKS